jgi:hypothetical protein
MKSNTPSPSNQDGSLNNGVPLRCFPYPFHHVLSIQSDIDGQTAELGVWIHDFLNRRLGLPMGDSMWVQVSRAENMGLLLPDSAPNRTLTKVEDLPVFLHLLREWHSGTIDQLHSWHDDYTYQVRNDFDPPFRISGQSVFERLRSRIGARSRKPSEVVDVPPVPRASKASLPCQHLRLYFDSYPKDVFFALTADDKAQPLMISEKDIHHGSQTQYMNAGNSETIIDLYLPNLFPDREYGADKWIERGFNALKRIDFFSTSSKNCHLLAIERDNFSRLSVISQSYIFNKYNLSPFLWVMHGGRTYAQNLGEGKPKKNMPRNHGKLSKQEGLVTSRETIAAEPQRHSYHVDVLQNIGIKAVWLFNTKIAINGKPTCRPLTGIPFFAAETISFPKLDLSTKQTFFASLRDVFPDFSEETLINFYCSHPNHCQMTKREMLGLAIELILTTTLTRDHVDQMIKTHWGSVEYSIQGQEEPKLERPFKENTLRAFQRLACRYYGRNLDGNADSIERVWVLPPSSHILYRKVFKNLNESNSITIDDNSVKIISCFDASVNAYLPDSNAKSRDLHGITIYHDSPQGVYTYFDNYLIKTIVNNPEDNTIKNSLTIIDNTTPSIILGGLPLQEIGTIFQKEVIINNCRLDDSSNHYVSYYSFSFHGHGKQSVEINHFDLHLKNITHFHIKYRKFTINPNACFFVDIITHQGKQIRFTEDQNIEQAQAVSEVDAAAILDSSHFSNEENWLYCTIPLYGIKFSLPQGAVGSEGFPLPLGSIKQVRIGLVGSNKGDRVDIGKFIGLRPNPSARPNGPFVVGGKFLNKHGDPLKKVDLQASLIGFKYGAFKERKWYVATDDFGFYTITDVPRGAVLELHELSGNSCLGKIFVLRNDLSIDFCLSQQVN